MKLKDLKKNERNPRKISSKKRDGLRKSVEEFGDLGGIVYNIRSKRLVGGHQRSSVLDEKSTITIDKKYDEPTSAGTVAEGFVISNGERFSYREVDWSQKHESAAMLAANNHQGEWDRDLLSVIIQDIDDLDVTGFDIPGLKALDITPPQISDEKYISETVKVNEQIETSNPNENIVRGFEDVEEKKMDVVNKRYVIIIDCKDEDHKQSLREKLRPLIEESEANIF